MANNQATQGTQDANNGLKPRSNEPVYKRAYDEAKKQQAAKK